MGPIEQQALEQRLEAMALLAGGIAHDFKNLLTVALGYIEMASTEAACPDKVTLYCDKASAAVQRSTGLMQQMLAFTRVSAPGKKPLDFARILKNSVIIAIGESPVAAEFALDGVPPLLEADERQLAQVITILVRNAVQAMPEGGKLSVIAGNQSIAPGGHFALAGGDYCRVSFADTGTGIAPGDLPRIFDPFFTTKSACAGLGLSIAYAIMKRHGGFIEASSVQGAGAEFVLFLPIGNGTPA
jgi:signal transduction histidine kinase